MHSKIMPFRYALGPSEPVPCVACHEEINKTPAYPLVDAQDNDKLTGWICALCYDHLKELTKRIHRHALN